MSSGFEHRIVRVEDRELRKRIYAFIDEYHSYIKYSDRPSRKMYYALFENDALVGVFALSTVFDKPKSVSEYMKKHGLGTNEVANNIVYCLYGHQDKNAGSKFLAMLRRDSVKWWKERYGDDLKAFQTFVLPPRNGAVYKADNWTLIGETAGKSAFVRTIRPSELDQYPEAQRKVFRSGEVKYVIRGYKETESKLIFMKLA